MTKIEAIAILEAEAEYLYATDKPYNREAFKMAIDALSEKTGKWKEEHLITKDLVYCSECGFGKMLDELRPYNYCPNCGARMDIDYE